MKILIHGAGWYGCHLALSLRRDHDVLVVERGPAPFSGASGGNPARLHIGPHYPRSKKTRAACQRHTAVFMDHYGQLTRPVRQNIYAVAEAESMVDFGTYEQILREEIPFFRVHDPAEIGLQNVEGAIQVAERHVVIREAREYFTQQLQDILCYGAGPATEPIEQGYGADLVIDCTFCAGAEVRVDRYEPCLTVILEGPTDTAITIMDGPFPSLYPWDEAQNLCSLTSAKLTPLARVRTWQEAHGILMSTTSHDADRRAEEMLEQMARYYPQVRETHRVVGKLLSIRAMPFSGADARLVEVASPEPWLLQIRAGKIDAIFDAEAMVRAHIKRLQDSKIPRL